MECDRLARRTTFWRDRGWCADEPHTLRSLRARPGRQRRWEDDLHRYAAHEGWESWQAAAGDVVKWRGRGAKLVIFDAF